MPKVTWPVTQHGLACWSGKVSEHHLSAECELRLHKLGLRKLGLQLVYAAPMYTQAHDP